jgi:choline dehydrogenase-like flavoprotein
MGSSADDSVCRRRHRVWDVPNVFLTDRSAPPTRGAANPALTTMAASSHVAEVLQRKRLVFGHGPLTACRVRS